MDVYTTNRNCGYPDWVAANAKKNVTEAKIGSNGWQLQQVHLPVLPFALPQSGIEAMWNFIVRYRGNPVEWEDVVAAVSPRLGQTKWIQTHGPQKMFYPWGAKGSTTPIESKNVHLEVNIEAMMILIVQKFSALLLTKERLIARD